MILFLSHKTNIQNLEGLNLEVLILVSYKVEYCLSINFI